MPEADSVAATLAHANSRRAEQMLRDRRGPKDAARSRAVQRLVPDSLAFAIGGRYVGRRLMARRDPRQLTAAYRRLVATTGSGADPVVIAHRAVELAGRATVALYRPWVLAKASEVGGPNVRDALEAGRPLLVSHLHSTSMFIGLQLAVMRGYVRYAAADAWLDDEPLSRYAWTIRARTEELGGRYVVGERSYGAIRELLRRGENCSVAFGLPGDTPVTFMSKPARVRSGLARLALDSGALICPSYTVCDAGGRIVCHRLPLLRPQDFGAPQPLMQAVATSFERVLLARPELWEPHDPCDPVGSAMRLWPD